MKRNKKKNFARNSFFYENISFFKLNNQKNKQKGKRLFTFLLKYKRIEWLLLCHIIEELRANEVYKFYLKMLENPCKIRLRKKETMKTFHTVCKEIFL
ncbi:hypothetical protein BW152_06725 [Lactococcus lactis]|uniref:hypothetical protein n=1 Tax=Lactococcus lactis TaxID=1358 RepID=UPI000BF26EC9|nr:hypothetical protein [Lactococcus lactis]PFG83748.1 hypothetical protein BW152_06725 [Lactococcus lactis]